MTVDRRTRRGSEFHRLRHAPDPTIYRPTTYRRSGDFGAAPVSGSRHRRRPSRSCRGETVDQKVAQRLNYAVS